MLGKIIVLQFAHFIVECIKRSPFWTAKINICTSNIKISHTDSYLLNDLSCNGFCPGDVIKSSVYHNGVRVTINNLSGAMKINVNTCTLLKNYVQSLVDWIFRRHLQLFWLIVDTESQNCFKENTKGYEHIIFLASDSVCVECRVSDVNYINDRIYKVAIF